MKSKKVLFVAGIVVRFGVGKVLIKRYSQGLLGMCKALLVAEKFNVVLSSKVLEFLDFLSRESVGGGDVRIAIQLENVFGVQVEEVHLVFSHGGNHRLEEGHIRDRSSADVVHPAAVFH